MSKFDLTRRGVMKAGAAGLAVPTIFTAGSAAAYTNEPTGGSVTLGFNVPQTGPYADEGNDELLAQELAVQHLNGEGDGGCLNTFTSKALKGNGMIAKKFILRGYDFAQPESLEARLARQKWGLIA